MAFTTILRGISGFKIHRRGDENGWIYPSVEKALNRAGMFTMSTYVTKTLLMRMVC
jgi:hypothetical protein